MSPSALLGQPRQVDDLVVTLTAIPDLSEVLGRGARRRASGHLRGLMARGARQHDAAHPARFDVPALVVPGAFVRATISLEDGPVGEQEAAAGPAAKHWHLAMSLSRDGQRGPAPAHELGAWIAVGWPNLAAVDTYLMPTLVTARHTLLPLID